MRVSRVRQSHVALGDPEDLPLRVDAQVKGAACMAGDLHAFSDAGKGVRREERVGVKEEENVARCPRGAAVHLTAPALFGNGRDDAGMADGPDGAPRGVPVHHDDLDGIDGGLGANMGDEVIDALVPRSGRE